MDFVIDLAAFLLSSNSDCRAPSISCRVWIPVYILTNH